MSRKISKNKTVEPSKMSKNEKVKPSKISKNKRVEPLKKSKNQTVEPPDDSEYQSEYICNCNCNTTSQFKSDLHFFPHPCLNTLKFISCLGLLFQNRSIRPIYSVLVKKPDHTTQ